LDEPREARCRKQAVQLLSSSAAGITSAVAGCSLPTISPRIIMYEFCKKKIRK
jgi:hypothetical protein